MRNMTREEQARKILDAILISPPRADEVAHVAACLMEICAIEREEERNVCAYIAETEEELEGNPPQHVIDAMLEAGPVMNARAAVRFTKAGIAKRIRERRVS